MLSVGPGRIELPLYPPQGYGLPLSDGPKRKNPSPGQRIFVAVGSDRKNRTEILCLAVAGLRITLRVTFC